MSVTDPIGELRNLLENVPESPTPAQTTPLIAVAVVGVLHQLGFVDLVNEMVSWDQNQCSISPGNRALALVLLPFLSTQQRVALVHVSQQLENIDTELLFGAPIPASAFTDDCLTRALDKFADACPSNFFQQLSLRAYAAYDIQKSLVLHSDVTSHELCGAYDLSAESNLYGPTICYGLNKTGRRDRKIFQTGVVADGNGLIRYCKTMDGNHADPIWNMEALAVLQEIFGDEFRSHTYIADSKLLTRPNMEILNRKGAEVRFISHIPSNFASKLADKYKSIARARNQWTDLGPCCTDEEAGKRATYRSQRFTVSLYGSEYELVLYETSAADKKVQYQLEKDQKTVETLIKERKFNHPFACEPDALRAIEELKEQSRKLLVEPVIEVTSETKQRWPRGRRGPETKPLEEWTVYHVQVKEITPHDERIKKFREKKETFALLTNHVESEMDDRSLLRHYKQQHIVENIFRTMKWSVMADRIYLNNPKRIDAMMTLLYVSYLVMGILQMIARMNVKKFPEPPGSISTINR
ncbi:IS1634 family transposase [Methanocalculus sp.]|uniref:IS1634 family transposase n=1 Tax=Methanocalculus sp. TaxID=2004547 RepID=UPI0017CC7FAA|nr:IS1634 family transposase [Methanocalculus sp.]HIJ05883.1 IS1634 family transposase [Methanocalculus sp.]